jgi:hypothetical protein
MWRRRGEGRREEGWEEVRGNGNGRGGIRGNCKDSNGSTAPCAGRMTTTTTAIATGGIGIIPRKASWIFATMARPITTNLVVAAELGTAVAAAVAAKAVVVGTATKKLE